MVVAIVNDLIFESLSTVERRRRASLCDDVVDAPENSTWLAFRLQGSAGARRKVRTAAYGIAGSQAQLG
jgi:hypothetical protein